MEVTNLEVLGLNSSGEGIVRLPSGKFCFVPWVWPGDRISIAIEEEHSSYARGRCLAVHRASPERRDSPCEHSAAWSNAQGCGGCAWIGVHYSAQLHEKQHRVRQEIARAKLSDRALDDVVQNIWASPTEFGYRNRAQFKWDGHRLGFLKSGSHEVIDNPKCGVVNEKVLKLRSLTRDYLRSNRVEPRPPHPFVFVDLDDSMSASDDLVINSRRPFRQGNSPQNDRMKLWIVDQLKEQKNILELFCGSGNFTESLACEGRRIVAAEVQGEATHELRIKALPGVEVLGLDLYTRGVWNNLLARKQNWDAVLLDPPRTGAIGVEALLESPKLQKLVYVSCDLATWIRDARKLVAKGARLDLVQPVDLFPQTPHVEVLSSFSV